MKAAISLFIILALFSQPLVYSQTFTEYDYQVNGYKNGKCCPPLGYGNDQFTSTAVDSSMLGWGIGLAAFIAILAGVISQSTGSSSSSSSSNSSSS